MEDDIRASVASAFGPEQMAVFSREMAQAASNCCPHGVGEGRIRKLSDADLRDRIADAEMELHRPSRTCSGRGTTWRRESSRTG